MSPILKNIIAIVVGFIVGMIVNGGLIGVGNNIIPLPDGIDPNSMEDMKTAYLGLPFKHFIMPFLAHALGTLAGAFAASKIAATHNLKFALGIGIFFLLGGIYAQYLFRGPIWFLIVDLAFAYIPMAFLGNKLAGNK